MTSGQIAQNQNSNQRRIETILHIVLNFLLNRAYFQKGEASTNFGIGNNKCLYWMFFLIFLILSDPEEAIRIT